MRRAAVVLAGFALALQGCASATPQSQPSVSSTPTPSVTPSVTPSPSVEPKDAIYRAGVVPRVKCTLPAGLLTSKEAVARYAKALMGCLDKAWAPVVSHAGTTYAPPLLYAVQVGAATACGEFDGEGYSAYYCTGNGAIYLNWQEYAEPSGEDSVEAQVGLQYLISHEHGHHLQQLLRISTSYDEEAVTKAELEESRRHELQASCFGFAFLGANRTTLGLSGYRKSVLDDFAETGDQTGDPRDHGSPQNNLAWSRAAFASKNPASCNTWAAPANKVS